MCRRYAGSVSAVARRGVPTLVALLGLVSLAPMSRGQVNLGPITVGAGLRTSFEDFDTTGGDNVPRLELNDIRLYVNGPVMKDIKFMFNTDYNGADNSVNILDAVARIEVNDKFNIWAGRFLPPSDRANLYGPFYAHEWNVYTDGIQDGYPFIYQGRDNGVAYWGTFAKKVKVSLGAFDGLSLTGQNELLGAARVQVDFWDPEDGYYLNGTYYGDKNLLAIGGATQFQKGNTATTLDFLLEKKVGHGGAFTIESEYANYNGLGGYNPNYHNSQGAYGLASFLIPKKVGVGQFEILGKFAKADFTSGATPSYSQKTGAFNFNYVMKQFNARIMSFWQMERFNRQQPNAWQAGLGLQIQM